ncbi:MAG: DUF1330 domain-containing protein [Alphaproteobacteria bacterium]|nr:DUF1330 domain-containing protein [Alphaproteobacteria bacterium]
MVAYWIAHAHINVPDEYKKYTDPVPEIIGRRSTRPPGSAG